MKNQKFELLKLKYESANSWALGAIGLSVACVATGATLISLGIPAGVQWMNVALLIAFCSLAMFILKAVRYNNLKKFLGEPKTTKEELFTWLIGVICFMLGLIIGYFVG